MFTFFSLESASLDSGMIESVRLSYREALRNRAKLHDDAGDYKSSQTADTCREYANKVGDISPFALQLAGMLGINMQAFVTQEHYSERPTNPAKRDMISIYSFSKFWDLLDYLATGHEQGISKGDTATNAATLVALLITPIMEQKKFLDFNVNAVMTNLRRFQLFTENNPTSKRLQDWHAESKVVAFGAGSVQSSSSINALRAIGAVSKSGRNVLRNAISAHLCRMAWDTVSAWTYANPSECPMSVKDKTPDAFVHNCDMPEWIDETASEGIELSNEEDDFRGVCDVIDESGTDTTEEVSDSSEIASPEELVLTEEVEETAKERKARKARERRAAAKAEKEAQEAVQEAA